MWLLGNYTLHIVFLLVLCSRCLMLLGIALERGYPGPGAHSSLALSYCYKVPPEHFTALSFWITGLMLLALWTRTSPHPYSPTAFSLLGPAPPSLLCLALENPFLLWRALLSLPISVFSFNTTFSDFLTTSVSWYYSIRGQGLHERSASVEVLEDGRRERPSQSVLTQASLLPYCSASPP